MSISKKCSCSWPKCAWILEQIDLFADDKRAVSGNEISVTRSQFIPEIHST